MDPTKQILLPEGSLWLMNASLAIIMLAVAMGLDFRDLPAIRRKPFSLSVGLISQWLLLPLITLIFVWIFDFPPYIGLGLILVSVCPGGNVSNFFTLLSKGNVALSVALTMCSTLCAVLVTPFGFTLFSNWSPYSANSHVFDLKYTDVIPTLALILVLPLTLGFLARKYYPIVCNKLNKPLRYLGILLLGSFIIGGLWQHRGLISSILPTVFLPVLFHNALAFSTGHFAGSIAGLRKREVRTITIETGIQNSGLALVIIFTFFDGQQEMAAVAAWWGIWHMIAGSALAVWYYYRDKINPE